MEEISVTCSCRWYPQKLQQEMQVVGIVTSALLIYKRLKGNLDAHDEETG